jgi:hypothetical protein
LPGTLAPGIFYFRRFPTSDRRNVCYNGIGVLNNERAQFSAACGS